MASLAFACHKDAAYTTLQPVKFNATVTSSASAVTLNANTDSTDVITLKWTAAVYPAKLAVKYVVQIDVPTDTALWTNAKTATVGTDVLTKTFKGADINSWALALGIPGNETGNLVFRVQAFEDRFAYSKPVVVSVLTYVHLFVPPPPPASLGYPVLYLPGDYQGWSPPTAGTVAAPANGVYKTGGVYEGFIYEPAGGTYQFKFTSAPDWNHINYGDAGTAGRRLVPHRKADLLHHPFDRGGAVPRHASHRHVATARTDRGAVRPRFRAEVRAGPRRPGRQDVAGVCRVARAGAGHCSSG